MDLHKERANQCDAGSSTVNWRRNEV